MRLEIKRNITNATSLRFIFIKYKKYISSVKIDARKTSQNVHMKPYKHLWRHDKYRLSVSELKTYNVVLVLRPSRSVFAISSLVNLPKLVAFYDNQAVLNYDLF